MWCGYYYLGVCVVQVVSLTARMTARVLVVLSGCWEGVRLFVRKLYKSGCLQLNFTYVSMLYNC